MADWKDCSTWNILASHSNNQALCSTWNIGPVSFLNRCSIPLRSLRYLPAGLLHLPTLRWNFPRKAQG
jgi:hypothetical protein